MNKHLPENIDDFFSDNLKDYDENPDEDIWNKIEQRLPKRKQKWLSVKYVSVAAATAVAIALPYLLFDSPGKTNFITGTKPNHQNFDKQQSIMDNIKVNQEGIKVQVTKISKYGISSAHYQSSVTNKNIFGNQRFRLANTGNGQTLNIYSLHAGESLKPGILSQNILKEEKSDVKRTASNTGEIKRFKFRGRSDITVIPFFSFDHISGRFIERYEFDNQDKNDYSKREKPDVSFTVGSLVEYKLNRKFSALAGLSFSNSNISITSTAVNALKDASGVYKFKLATSYGLAEISKSGVDPTAGDSLLISDAAMQFNYISLPVLFKYNINSKKIKLSIHGGVALNKMTGVKVNAEYVVQNNKEAETINKVEGLRKTFFTINTGCDFSYMINKLADISLSPELRYGINSINKGTPVKTYPVNYGLALGLRLKL